MQEQISNTSERGGKSNFLDAARGMYVAKETRVHNKRPAPAGSSWLVVTVTITDKKRKQVITAYRDIPFGLLPEQKQTLSDALFMQINKQYKLL